MLQLDPCYTDTPHMLCAFNLNVTWSPTRTHRLQNKCTLHGKILAVASNSKADMLLTRCDVSNFAIAGSVDIGVLLAPCDVSFNRLAAGAAHVCG